MPEKNRRKSYKTVNILFTNVEMGLLDENKRQANVLVTQ